MGVNPGEIVSVETIKPGLSYLEAIRIEISRFNRNSPDEVEVSADRLSEHFVKAYNDVAFSQGEEFTFNYRGTNYRGEVKHLDPVQLTDQQRDGTGLMMQKTDVQFSKKEGDRMLKLKPSANKYTSPPPNRLRLQKN